jgi:hypothetical protein
MRAILSRFPFGVFFFTETDVSTVIAVMRSSSAPKLVGATAVKTGHCRTRRQTAFARRR